MYKINHERTRSAGEKIGIALLIAGILHMALNQSFLLSNIPSRSELLLIYNISY